MTLQPPRGWKTAWDLNPPQHGDADLDEYLRLGPAMIEYQQALIDASEPPPPLQPTAYSNGHEMIQPVWDGIANGAVTAEDIRRAMGERSSGIDAADLLALELPELREIVPGIFVEGTNLLSAPPKTGKSCLVYQAGVEVSLGGELLGERVQPGSVLYLALEDGQRRGRDRLRAALAGRTMPRGRLEVRWSAPRIGEGLEDELADWLDTHADAALVAVDTLGRVRPAAPGKKGNAYDEDVASIGRLQSLFRDRRVALLLVHHLNKGSSDDFVAQVSGTYGISGSVDTIVNINRKRLEAFGTITVTGRDVADHRVAVRFDEMTWTLAPEALVEATFQRTEIYRAIEEIGPAWPKAIADHLGLERTNVQHRISRLVDDGAVERTAQGYRIVAVRVSSIPSPSNHSISDMSDGGDSHTRAHAREGDLLDLPVEADYPASAYDAEPPMA